MKKILIERTNKAYLPEVNAYVKYFNNKNFGFQVYDSSKIDEYHLNDFDCVWRFMGIDAFQKLNIPVIHEYHSLSTGRFPKLKNKVKKIINSKPDLRIFLSKLVEEELGFNDHVDYLYRDMGVDDLFFQSKNSVKNYDCVYVGSIVESRDIHLLLDYFKYHGKNCSILLIGEVQDNIYKNYSFCDNITFTGKIPYEDVPKYASQAVYGINYMPDKYPLNVQTSTKLLEYLAMGLKVITTEYFWINNYMKENDLNLITVNKTLDNLQDLIKSNEGTPNKSKNMEKYKWSNILEQAEIGDRLLKLL